jgi:hypothetical protein
MKSPPRQYTDNEARELTAAFISDDEQGVFARAVEAQAEAKF